MKKFLLISLVLGIVWCAQWWYYAEPTISLPFNDASFGYIIKYPKDNGRSDRLPMLVALHGNGDTVENFYNTALDKVNVPVRIVLLKPPKGRFWPSRPEHFRKNGPASVNEAIELLMLKYPTAGKPILLGFSGGAQIAYYQALKHGDCYSYIVPVSGGLSNDLLGYESAKPGAKVFALHGKKDSLARITEGRRAVDILKRNGVDVAFTEFDGNHHGIFTNMKPKITMAIEKHLLRLQHL